MAPIGESDPAIEHGSALCTTTAGPNSDGGCGALNHIAEANVLIGDEPRKAHTVRLSFTFI
jgi:hypothetical protein